MSDLAPLRDVLEAHGLSADKRFGQHFLLDLNVTRKIARLAGPFDGDVVIEDGGIRVIVEAEHLPFVHGASIDFSTDAGAAGFRIDNPNVVYGCGCGNSFLLRDDAGAAV